MKKFQARTLLSLLLAVLLLAALPSAALAADLSLTVGERYDYCIEQRSDPGYITGVSIVSGSCPGMTLYVNSDGTGAYIGGTPTTAGDYTVSVSVAHSSGDPYSTTLTLHVAEAVIVTPTPTPEATPSPTPEVNVDPTPTPVPEVIVEDPASAKLVITKDPTGETVVEGGSAVFIARADNATEIIWLLVSSDGKTSYRCSDAPNHFTGLQVSGLGTERLVLSNIPLDLNGWQAQAMFNGEGGPLYSKGASITVTRSQLTAPTISAQPRSVDASNGGATTLVVTASASEGQLRYQWYKANGNRNTGGQAIVGATGASYSPTGGEGTVYYYVTVWAVSGDRSSTSVSSNVASVTFPAATATPAPTPTPEATAEPTPAPEESAAPVEEPTPAPEATPAQTAPARRGGAGLIVTAVILLLGAAASVGVYIYLRRRDQNDDEDEEDEDE